MRLYITPDSTRRNMTFFTWDTIGPASMYFLRNDRYLLFYGINVQKGSNGVRKYTMT